MDQLSKQPTSPNTPQSEPPVQKKRVSKLLFAAIPVLLIAAAGWFIFSQQTPNKAPDKPKTSGKVMTVGKYYWPDQYWVEIAEKKGWFKEAGLNVQLVDTNPDYYKSLQDVVDGKLDTQDFYLFDLINYNVKGADLVMVINNGQSAGSDGAIANKAFGSPQELKRKKIGLSKGTNSEYLLEVYLNKNNMKLEDVTLVDMVAEKAHEDFKKGEIDGFVAFEPFLEEAVKSGQGVKLFDTSQFPGVAPIGFVFKNKFIEERPEDVQAFVNVWHRTVTFIKENPQEAFGIIAQIYKKDVGEVKAFTQKDEILDLQENLTSYSYASGFESLHGSARQINNFLIDKKLATEQLDTTRFLNPRFIRTLERNQQ